MRGACRDDKEEEGSEAADQPAASVPGRLPAVPRDRLRDVASHRREAGILLDFDGTLSDIAPSPEEARPVQDAAVTLDSLSATFRVVAVVSGRRAGDVAELLGAQIRYYGLYGLEDHEGPISEEMPGSIERLLPEVERAAAYVPGARVEHKGIQLAVHYRGASDPEAAARVLRERLAKVATAHGLTLLEGKRVLELATVGGPTKGDVVSRLSAEANLRYLLYAGDDVADLEAFAAIDSLSSTGVVGMKVAVRSLETPEALLQAADVVVEGPRGLIELLRSLIEE
jgi:trehalose 6-phosphate phosphatase